MVKRAPNRKPAKKKSERPVPAAVIREMNRGLDRYMERWARGLLLVIDGEVRKLSEDEVQAIVRSTRSSARPPARRSAKRAASTRKARG